MEISSLLLIINPISGKEEPILEIASRVFADSSIKLDIHALEEGEDVGKLTQDGALTHQMVAIYGGDGSITEGASGLIGKTTPLAIIPGGTANVLSKELNIPQDTEEALKLIKNGIYNLRRIDTATVNNKPFLLRVNFGLMADMITDADPELKGKIGQLAYGFSAYKSWQNAEVVNYHLVIDGTETPVQAIALTVTNSGSMGIGGLQLAQGILIDDGLLDVVLLKEAGLMSVAGAAGSSLIGKESEAISHWRCKEISIKLDSAQTYICDDCEATAKEMFIRVIAASLTVVVPKED